MMIIALLSFMFIVLAAVGVVFAAIVGDIRASAVVQPQRPGQPQKSDMSRVSYLMSLVLIYAGLIGSFMTFVSAILEVKGAY